MNILTSGHTQNLPVSLHDAINHNSVGWYKVSDAQGSAWVNSHVMWAIDCSSPTVEQLMSMTVDQSPLQESEPAGYWVEKAEDNVSAFTGSEETRKENLEDTLMLAVSARIASTLKNFIISKVVPVGTVLNVNMFIDDWQVRAAKSLNVDPEGLANVALAMIEDTFQHVSLEEVEGASEGYGWVTTVSPMELVNK